MVWERVAKFESGALYAEMYLRQNQSRGNREKKREERLGGRETKDPLLFPRTAIDQRTRRGGRFDRGKKRTQESRNRSMKQSIVRLTQKERERERENVVRSFVYLKHITFYPPFRPLDGKARVASCRRYFIIPGKEKTVHNCKVNRISLIKFLLSTNEPLVYTMPDWSTNKCNFQPLFGLPWEYARTF